MAVPELFEWWVSESRRFRNNGDLYIVLRCSSVRDVLTESHIFHWGHILGPQITSVPEHWAVHMDEKDGEWDRESSTVKQLLLYEDDLFDDLTLDPQQ